MILPLAFAIFVIISTGRTAIAGGWAVVTLDRLPSELIVNQPVTIGFNVRQHGQTLLAGLQPTIAATRVGSNDTITAIAYGDDPTGHYLATLTFASAGKWEWYVDAFGSRQPMPPLTVEASQPISKGAYGDSQTLAATTRSQGVFLGGAFVVLFGVLVLLVAWRRRQPRWLLGVLAIGIVLGAARMAVLDRSSRSAASAASSTANPSGAVIEGRDLFIAKGCIVCHQNDCVQFSQEDFVQVKIGPDLTNRKLTSEFLHIWLKDPSKVKPGTLMPTLGLSEHEIDALTAFLTAPEESQ